MAGCSAAPTGSALASSLQFEQSLTAHRYLLQQQQPAEDENASESSVPDSMMQPPRLGYDNITVVASPQELLLAVTAGVEHIELREHISLASLSIDLGSTFVLGPYASTIKSIRV